MAIEFKTPLESEIALMKDFASVIDTALGLLANQEIAHVSNVVASKLQEALMWFSHGVLNQPSAPIEPIVPPAPADAPVLPPASDAVN